MSSFSVGDDTIKDKYIGDITRWREHVKIIFEKINFTCSNQLVIFFLLHRYECFSDIFTSKDMENISLVSRM